MTKTSSGLYVPLLTPLSTVTPWSDNTIGASGCEYLISAGVDGLVAFGTTGEFPRLLIEKRLEAADPGISHRAR